MDNARIIKAQRRTLLFESRPPNISLSKYYNFVKEYTNNSKVDKHSLDYYSEIVGYWNKEKNADFRIKSPEYYKERNARKTRNKQDIKNNNSLKKSKNINENKKAYRDIKKAENNFKEGSLKIDEFSNKKKKYHSDTIKKTNKQKYSKKQIENRQYQKNIKIKEHTNSIAYKGAINSKNANTRRIATDELAELAGRKQLTSLEKTLANKSNQIKSMNIFKGAGLLVAAGTGLALTRRVFRNEEKNEKTSLTKDVVSSTMLTGLGAFGIVKVGTKASEKKIIAESLEKASGISNRALNDLNPNKLKAFNKGVEKSSIKRSTKIASSGKKALGAAAIFIGATSIIDSSLQKNYKRAADEQNKKDEKRLEDQQKQAAKYKQKKSMYYDTNMGQVALDLFNERIGHTNMGNARFK